MTVEKSNHLMKYVDLDRPELAAVKTADDQAAAVIAHLAQMPRPPFRFEYQRKAELLAFLRKHYRAWRRFDTAEADRLASLTIRQARAPRALATAAELGKAWWATGDPKYGAAFERFYLAVPTGEMFNWENVNGCQGAIELDAFFLLLDCDSFTTEGRIAFLDHLHAIADSAWDEHTSTWQQIMLGPEGHNWYLNGIHMLPLFGILFPEFRRARFLLRTGWSVVEEHVRGHLKADGGARETTPGYQVGSMCRLWDLYLIAHRNGFPTSQGFADRLLEGTKFLLRLMTPDGGLPSYGDSHHQPGQLTRLAAVAAALTADGECKWYAHYCRQHKHGALAETPGEIPLCAFWDVGLAGAASYARTRQHNPRRGSVLMGPTGYVAMRNSDRPDANYMAIAAADRGPIVTSHGHNEVFSLEVHAGGVRFIGDMGCAPYGTGQGRLYDQRTEAHTCLSVEGMEQVPIIDEWRWAGCVTPSIRRWISQHTHDFFHGVHEGYYHYPKHQTLHARKVLFVKPSPSYWVVLDWLESNVANTYCAYFHGCVPGRLDGSTILLGAEGSSSLAIVPAADDEIAVERVASEGLQAYIREKKLDAESCPCFVYRKRAASHCFVWVLIPLAPGQKPPQVRRIPVAVNRVKADAHAAVAVGVDFAECTDMVCVSHKDFDALLQCSGQSAWGHLAFRRRRPGREPGLSFEHTTADGICGR